MVYWCVEENFSKIKIIQNTWAECQKCHAHIRLLPEIQPVSLLSAAHPDNIKLKKDN
jgi:hypothetical protein